MSKITLNESDLRGKGSNAEVYNYKLKNIDFAVKCFKDHEKALEENNILEQIYKLMPNCPGAI